MAANFALVIAIVSSTIAHAQVPPIDVSLATPGPRSAVSLPLELAVKLGLDRAEGINLRLKFVGGGGVALQDIRSGVAEFGVFGLTAAMGARLNDPRIVALAAVEDLPVWVLMVRNGLRGKIRRVADLKGLTVGNHSDSLGNKTAGVQIMELVLLSHGIALDAVRFTSAGQSWETQSAAIASGTVDAIMTDEPFATRMISEKIAFPIYSTADPEDAKRTPGAGFLRAALIGRKDRIDANPVTAERMAAVIRRALEWIHTHSAEQVAEVLDFKSAEERTALLANFRKYPRLYSRDAKFSNVQLRETELFFRASMASDPAAQRFSVDSMIIDRWVGKKP